MDASIRLRHEKYMPLHRSAHVQHYQGG
jgi:hypothetical protein